MPLRTTILIAGLATTLSFAVPAWAQSAEPAGVELETCELLVPGTPLSVVGQCGWLDVAENPAEPDGRRIRIHVARVPASGRVTEPDPLVFFAGGPGQAATESWPILAGALRKVNESRDILLVDQRGTGQSHPLKCPQVELEDALLADWDALADRTHSCLESLDADPRFYTTTIAMHDIDAARRALGYERVNLYGGSYGTRAAQVYYRLFPDQVRTIVLDGVVPQTLGLGTEHAIKLDQAVYRVLAACEADTDCATRFPDTAGKLRDLLRRVVEDPVDVTIEHPTTGEPVTLNFEREVLASALRFLSYSPETQAMLPMLIHEAATEQRFDRLASQMMITATGLQQTIAQGMEMSVMCAEDYPLFPRRIEPNDTLLGTLMDNVVRVQCGVWPAGPVPDDFHEPVSGDVPVLLLSGEYDPVTPPEYGDAVAAHFGQATHLVAPGQAHIVATRGCMGDLVSTFIIDGHAGNLDTACMARLERSPFFHTLTGPAP
ncbi:MAG: alpha/beta hydrolase [Xanthomonadales bacterium]